jgi:hypothetical protein
MLPIIKLFSLLAITGLLCLKPGAGAFYKKGVLKWVVQKNSTLTINGSSNVNKFQCGIQGYYKLDTISFSSLSNNPMVPLNGALTINVLDLDCNSKMITRDLRKTLKAEDYPDLVIRFVALERMPAFERNNQDAVKGWVEVILAGVCKRFEIPFVLNKVNNCTIQLNGIKAFSFTDFRLAPPKKIAGLVKVHDKFEVDFHLQLTQVIN